jgi:ABC-type protease/lipase transport system fused ATPase/permease subunit
MCIHPSCIADLLPSSCCRDSADEDTIQEAASRAGLDAAVPQMKSGYATQVQSRHMSQAANVQPRSRTALHSVIMT